MPSAFPIVGLALACTQTVDDTRRALAIVRTVDDKIELDAKGRVVSLNL